MRTTGRVTIWIVLTVAVLIVFGGALIALPEVVRRLAVTRIAEATGEAVSIADVDFNPFTGGFHAAAVRVGEPGAAAPLLTVDAVAGRLRLVPLLSGQVRLDEATFSRPVLRIARVTPGDLNVSPLIDRWRRQPPRESPLDAAIDRLTIVDGTVMFEDRVLSPVRRWSAEHLSVDLREVSTAPEGQGGSGLLTFAAAGGRVSIAARTLDVTPFAAEVILRVQAVPLTSFYAYLPPNREVAPVGGLMDAAITAAYDASGGLRGDGWLLLRDIVLQRQGQREPFVTIPALTVSATELTLRGAAVGAAGVSVSAAPTVVDARVSPARRFEFRSTSLVMHDVQWPGGGRSPVEVAGVLADGASMTGRGTLDLDTLSADLELALVGVSLEPFTAYLPPDAPVALRGGVLQAKLHLRHAGATEVRISGNGTVRDLALVRRDVPGDLVSIPALAFSITDTALIDGVVTVQRVELAGDPTIADATVSPPRLVTLRESRVVVEALRWPPGPAARIEATTRVATGGSVALTGTVVPSPLGADLAVTATDLDLRPLRPYLPADSPVQFENGILTARAAVRYAGATTEVDGTGTVARVAVRRRDRSEPFVRARAVGFEVAGLAIADGRVTARRIVVSGAPNITDATVTPPQRVALRETRVVVETLSWPQGPPARIEATTRVATGGSVALTGTVVPSPLGADVAVTATDLDLRPFRAYVPADSQIQLEDGLLTARAAVRYAGGTTQVEGTGTVARLGVGRRDQSEPFLTARALDVEMAGLQIADGTVSARRLVVSGNAAITDPTVSPPPRVALRNSRVVVEALSWPQGPPARIELTTRVARTGSLAVRGTVALSPLGAELAVTATDLDLRPFRAYVPADSPVQLGRGTLTARATVRHAAGIAHVDGAATAQRLMILRRDRSEPFLTAAAIDVEATGLAIADGHFSARRMVVRGKPTIVDATASPAQRYDFERLRVTVSDAARPSTAPARVELIARAAGGGTVRATGRVDLTSLETELVATIEGVPVRRAHPYLPGHSPLSLASGIGGGRMSFAYSREGGPRVSADLTIRDFTVDRKGQREPLVSVPVLIASVSDVAIGEGLTTADRIELRGDVRIVDGLASPSRRVDVRDAQIRLDAATWPATSPARVRLTGDVGAGRVQVTGTVAAPPLQATLQALVIDIDVTQLTAYVPDMAGIVVERGRASATARIRHDEASGTRIDGQVTGIGLELTRGANALAATVPTVTVAIRDGHIRDGRVTAARVEVDGGVRVMDRSPEESPPVDLEALRIVAERVAWPVEGEVPVTMDAAFTRGGTLTASGSLALTRAAHTLQVKARGIPAAMVGSFLPAHARVRGEIDADLALGIEVSPDLRIGVTGTAHGRALALGPRRRPHLAVEHVTVTGIEVEWPRRLIIGTLVLGGPSATIERTETGHFPLRERLVGPRANRSSSTERMSPELRPSRPQGKQSGRATAFEIGRLVVQNGYARFVDRSTSPFYSEELSELAVTIEGFSTAPDAQATLRVQGALGVHAAVDLRGEIAPFADPFFLEVRGEIRDFPASRVNPYAQKFLDWIARTGEITTEVHYRVVGDRLEATNEIVVQRLNVARAGREREVAERIGMPLGLAIALLKDARGDIRLTVPVTGRLGSPEFSFGDAIGTALRNIVVKAVTAPFRLLGKLFEDEEQAAVPDIDPVEFAPGAAILTPALERELQRVADFLRASPFVGLELLPIVSHGDLRELAARQVTASIQELQHTRGLASFDAAAVQHFRERFPGRTAPENTEAIVTALREAESIPEDAGQRLAQRRLESTRRMLVERAGIEPKRLQEDGRKVPPGASGAGRVEFTLVPADG